MLLLFGAGASNGAGGIEGSPPPLGKDLFGELFKRFTGTWGALPKEISGVFEKSRHFEDGMEGLLDGKFGNLAALLKDMGIFFSGFRINSLEDNYYYKLADKYLDNLKSKELIIATTNYECLIELAIQNLGSSFIHWESGEGIEILKLHGSCNFVQNTFQVSGKAIINQYFTMNIPLIHISPADVEKNMKNNQIPPAMSLYIKDKDRFDFIGAHERNIMLSKFHDYLKEIELAIVIGLRPNPEDHHIWDHLRDLRGRIFLVGGLEECKDWGRQYRPKDNDIWLSETFVSAFPAIINKIDIVLGN